LARWAILLLVLVPIVIVFWAAAFMDEILPPSSSTTSQPAGVGSQPPVPPAGTWHEVQTWRGSGVKETETFHVASREWRIKWRSSSELVANAGMLQIYVHKAGGEMVSLARTHRGRVRMNRMCGVAPAPTT
jgi:hypothetical protein